MALQDDCGMELIEVLLTEVALVTGAIKDSLFGLAILSKLSFAGLTEGSTWLSIACLYLDSDFVDQPDIFFREDTVSVR